MFFRSAFYRTRDASCALARVTSLPFRDEPAHDVDFVSLRYPRRLGPTHVDEAPIGDVVPMGHEEPEESG